MELSAVHMLDDPLNDARVGQAAVDADGESTPHEPCHLIKNGPSPAFLDSPR